MSSSSSFLTPAGIVSASPADVVTPSSETQFVSPGTQFYHPSAAKTWQVFNGTTASPPKLAQFRSPANATRISTGRYRSSAIPILSPFYYAGVGISGNDTTGNNFVMRMISFAVSGFPNTFYNTVNIAGSLTNAPRISLIIFGVEQV